LIASVLFLAACGSSDNEEGQIEEAIKISATSTKPSSCKEVSTQQFMEQTTRSKGSEAVKACEKEASEGNGAKAVTVSKVEVDGSKATADTALTGGSLDGQEVEIALEKDGDQWKLDEITGFAKFDEEKVLSTFESNFAEQSSGVSKGQATCIVKSFKEAPQAEFEEALLSGTTEGFEKIAGGCFQSS
jgi:hypothetical protein